MKAKLIRPGKNGYTYREWHNLPGFLIPLWFLLFLSVSAILVYGIVSIPLEESGRLHASSESVMAGRHLAYAFVALALLLLSPLVLMKGLFVDLKKREVRTAGIPFLHTPESLPLDGLVGIDLGVEKHEHRGRKGDKSTFETFAVVFRYADDSQRTLIRISSKERAGLLMAELRTTTQQA